MIGSLWMAATHLLARLKAAAHCASIDSRCDGHRGTHEHGQLLLYGDQSREKGSGPRDQGLPMTGMRRTRRGIVSMLEEFSYCQSNLHPIFAQRPTNLASISSLHRCYWLFYGKNIKSEPQNWHQKPMAVKRRHVQLFIGMDIQPCQQPTNENNEDCRQEGE